MPKKRICEKCSSVCYSTQETALCKNCYTSNYRENNKFSSRKEYAKNWQLQKKYGIDLDGLYVLWVAFEGNCGICGVNLTASESSMGQKRTSCCVDHNHHTGNLRGLLCNSCNKALGLFNDNPEIVLKAYNWLGGSNEKISVDSTYQ